MSVIGFEMPPELVAMEEGIREFARREIIGRHERHRSLFDDPRKVYDEDGSHSPIVRELIREIRIASAEAGYFNMSVPEELGGSGLGMLAYYTGFQALFHTCGARNWMCQWGISHWALGPSRILSHSSPLARERVVKPLLSGEKSMCFGLSEPGAGSDATMIKTRARPEGDGWRVTGRKIWTTNSPLADFCLIFAVTDPDAAERKRGGISAFLVPTDAPGFLVQRTIRFWNQVGGDEGEIVLEDVRVEAWQLVGNLHEGFAVALDGVSIGRIYNSAKAVGLGRWALEQALDYTQTREAFGNPLSSYQAMAFPLAESATELHAAHLLGINAARLMDTGRAAVKEVSMSKYYSVEVAIRACNRAMQAHGAMGFTNELGLAEAYHLCRVLTVADGTDEILKRTIAQRLFKGDTAL